MAGCLKRCFTKCVPAEDEHKMIVCPRHELTEFEQTCFLRLKRMSCPIVILFLVNLALSISIYKIDGTGSGSECAQDVLTAMPMMAQVRFVKLTANTDMGLQIGWLQQLRTMFLFFILIMIVRLYTKVSLNGLACDMEEDAFHEGRGPGDLACSSGVQVAYSLSIVVYCVFSLMQLSIVQRIEETFMKRLFRMRAGNAGLEEGLLINVATGDSESGVSESSNIPSNTI
ncbi:hypothetical protein TeGR_g7278 [Tetraparma gracilis]|uniref:Uncharacterized protein n=1 Tax=Tetraparma gracilis TaxID=2962635 RepID=A0ABQ6M3E1_9STRA|nr:hypothetical protein TeGR_g7278 [Tetraparma gracilis]